MTTTSEVPAKFDVGLDGRGYMIDTQYLEGYRSQTLDPIRTQADSSSSVGEASLNPEGYWRRSPDSWHKGAGQARYDAADSDPERFSESIGVDVWTKGQLSLLRKAEATGVAATTTNTISRVVEVGNKLLAIELNSSDKIHVFTLGVSPSVNSVTPVLGDVTDICVSPDGSSQFFFVDSGRLYYDSSVSANPGSAATASEWIGDSPTTIAGVCSAGGRLFCTDTDGELYDISAVSLATLPASLGNIGGNGSRFTATSANGFTYFSADFSTQPVLVTTVKSDGSGLEVPTVAATLPAGEFIYNVYGYLGFVLLQTSAGMRLGVVGANGSLTLGESFLSALDAGIFGAREYRARGEFVYVHGFNNPILGFGPDSGLVRLDLSVINDALVPAFAADLNTGTRATFAYGLGETVSLVLANGELWQESDTDHVSYGVVQMGEVSFGTRESKLYLVPEDVAVDGSVQHTFTAPDGALFVNSNTTAPVPAVEWQMRLNPGTAGDDATLQYPILRALPVPSYIEIETVPVLLHDAVEDRNGQDTRVDTDAELDYLRGLRDAGSLIDYQDGARTRQAQVIGVDRIAAQRDGRGDQWQGTALVRMKVL